MRFLYVITALLTIACQGGQDEAADAGSTTTSDAGLTADAAVGQADATPSPDAGSESTCSADFIGSGDGCDCGCNVMDPDCPSPLTVSDCAYNNCGTGDELDPDDPTRCRVIQVPIGWTCSGYDYGPDGVCTCGCGVIDDKDCNAPLTAAQCYYATHGCGEGFSPDPDNPTQCIASPPG